MTQEHATSQWPGLDNLRPSIVVKNLYLSEQFARRITIVLQKPVEPDRGMTEVLPRLQSIFL